MDLIDSENLRWRYPRFFTCIDTNDEFQTISGGDARHINLVLRMKAGDKAVLSDNCVDYLCTAVKVSSDSAVFRVLESGANNAEAGLHIRLFQCMPKSDKLETITQKATELGVSEIIPVLSARCVSRPEPKSQAKKIERLQKIAYEAAKQSGRGKIPIIKPFVTFDDAMENFKIDNTEKTGIIFYECGGAQIGEIIKNSNLREIDIFIGSEGGFTAGEIAIAEERGIKTATLGRRILRVETAPIAAISILMNLTGNM